MTKRLGHGRRGLRGPLAAAALAASLFAALTAVAPEPIAAQTASETTPFENRLFRYTVMLPSGCRHEEGPGTVDAVCAPEFDPEQSALVDKTTALVLGVAAETLAGEGDTSVTGLQQRYGEAAFKEELPEAVCGESDKTRVRIENLKQTVEDTRLVYTADVICSAVKFLRIGERRASVRHVIGPDMRYRLLARAPGEDFAKLRGTIDAFFASFRALPPEK